MDSTIPPRGKGLEVKGLVSEDTLSALQEQAERYHRTRIRQCGMVLGVFAFLFRSVSPSVRDLLDHLVRHPAEFEELLMEESARRSANQTSNRPRKKTATENDSKRDSKLNRR